MIFMFTLYCHDDMFLLIGYAIALKYNFIYEEYDNNLNKQSSPV